MIEVYIAVIVLLSSCCINVIFLEHLIKASPDSGNLLLFLQFSFIALEGLIFDRNFGKKIRHVPLRNYAVMVLLFFISSATNNMALGFQVPMPLHMIFKSGSLVASMFLGAILLKRSYTVKKYISVLLVSLGIIICTYLSSTKSSNGDSDNDGQHSKTFIGVILLTISLFISARMGIYQESIALNYGKHPRETLFYNHALPLPFFLLLWPSIVKNYYLLNQSDPTPVPIFTDLLSTVSRTALPFEIDLEIPILWQYAAINVLTQYFCIRSVFFLVTECTSLTVTLIITLRKFISLIFSVVYFKNEFTFNHWIGTLFVFTGSLLYADIIQLRLPFKSTKITKISPVKNGIKNGYHNNNNHKKVE